MTDDSAKVVRINGCPGGGKTTELFSRVQRHQRDGMEARDMLYLTFTRTGRDEVADRLLGVFDGEDEIAGRAKTFHGAACSECYHTDVIDDVGEQVIQPGSKVDDTDPYRDFCAARGLSYDDEEKSPLTDDTASPTNTGNQLFTLADWLRYRQNPVENCNLAPEHIQLPTNYSRTVELLKEWDHYKGHAFELPLFEHSDYVNEAIERALVPGVDVLFVDEFQDLSPQEYLLFKTWRDSGEIETIYIAGDANQSIYSFRAGTPRYFTDTDVDETEDRTASYRCPEVIVSVGRGVLEAHPGTDPNGFTAKKSGGHAERHTLKYADDLAEIVRRDVFDHEPNDDENTVFMLARTNRQKWNIGRALENEGVPFRYIGLSEKRQPWRGELQLVHRGLEAIKAGQSLKHKPAAIRGAVVDVLPESWSESIGTHADLAAMDVHDVISRLGLPHYERDRLRNAITHDGWTDPAAVKVGTIHSSKGLEAPCVHLFDGYPGRMRREYQNGQNAAEEHRLYYVGATRASETLRVITGFKGMGTAVFPAFDGGLPKAAKARVIA